MKKNIKKLINKIKLMFQPHYQIIGHYTGEVIGCCRGKSGIQDVLEEEPLATFHRCSARNCCICKEYEL